MGNINSIQNINKINFEDMQKIINNKKYIIINTLEVNNQECLIKNTISPLEEVSILNKYINNYKNIYIIIYGKNNNDQKIFSKYQQLIKLGFINVYLYIGGLFEWLLLQDIYGFENFPTTSNEIDILKYK